METPSEWAKRFNRQKTDVEAGTPNPEAATADSPAAVPEFPSEPFQCPACGQLLAPACRVCVACKHTINPAEIARPQEVVLPAAHPPNTDPRLEPVRYPWRIFFVVLGLSFFLALIFEGLWGEQKAQLAMGGAQTLAGVWVFFDARRQGIPRPLRWGVGSMFLPVVIFPWYLARRRKPQSTVPFVEAQVGPVTRFLLFALLIFILASLIFYIVQGPLPATTPTPAPKLQKSGGNSQPRITTLHPWKEGGQQRCPGKGSRPMLRASSAQAETSAPSDARQT
ncbi:MAG: hypothetical protein ABSG32_04545 [Terriglobia bacterium]|jgi:hypothetical protein